MSQSAGTVVFIDGENFQKKLKQVYKAAHLTWEDKKFGRINLRLLFEEALPDYKLTDINYYVAKLHVYEETTEKSEELIALQRALKSNLSRQKVTFVMSGNVRMYPLEGGQLLFKEKGVDVRLAVDAVSLAADKKLKTAIICSSDSDMQSVVRELRRRKIKVIYVGFQIMPNKGLIFTCNETVLLRKQEIIKAFPKGLKINRFDDDIKPNRST